MTRGRTVYTTDRGRACPTCGWPLDLCRCQERREEAVPDEIVAKLRLERSGRAGKAVTIIDGLPKNTAFVEDLARALKKACATGGTAGEGRIELQGDRRERAAALLRGRGMRVKGA